MGNNRERDRLKQGTGMHFYKPVLKSAFKTLFNVMPIILFFEIIYRTIQSLVISPLLGWIVRLMVSQSGVSLLFNEQILKFFLTPYGWITAILLLVTSAFFIYLEYSIIVILLQRSYNGEKIKLNRAIVISLTTFDSLKGPGFIGFCLYSMLLIPLLNLGIGSSLIPSLAIPNFITGELLKSASGIILLVALTVIGLILYRTFLFVLPNMVLDGNRFGRASKNSEKIQKGSKLKVFVMQIIMSAFSSLAIIAFSLMLGVMPAIMVAVIAVVVQMLWSPMVLSITISMYNILGGKENINRKKLESLSNKKDMADSRLRAFLLRIFPSKKSENKRGFFVRHWRKFVAIILIAIMSVAVYGLNEAYNPKVMHQVVVGHRGSEYGVENTIGAIQGAIDSGAEYAEIDVLLSKDSVPMVIHDKHLARLADRDVNIYEATAEELGKETLRQNGYEDHIPTLEEVIEFSKGKIDLLIEFKEHGHETDSIVEKTFEVVKKTRFENHAIYHTLHKECFEEAVRLEPTYKVGFIVFSTLGSVVTKTLRDLEMSFITVEESVATESFINSCNKATLPVFVWTVNEEEAMHEFYSYGASAIVSDTPDVARKMLTEMKNDKTEK